MYFDSLPWTVYTIDGVQKLVTNILTRVTISNELKQNIFLMSEYIIENGETPEQVAFKFYNNTEYHWILMLINEIIYPWNDWPISTDALIKQVKDTYGVTNLYSTHHYEDINGLVINNGAGAYPVSNLDYESRLNDAKRTIKILDPALTNEFIKEFKNLVKATT